MSRKKDTALREAIRAGYRAGLTPREIAAKTGSTAASVKVIAHNMGVNDSPRVAAAKRAARRSGKPVNHHLNHDHEVLVEARSAYRELLREIGVHIPLEAAQ